MYVVQTFDNLMPYLAPVLRVLGVIAVIAAGVVCAGWILKVLYRLILLVGVMVMLLAVGYVLIFGTG